MGHEERGCYCSLWDTKPEFLEAQGVPRGFCGICDKCRQPGHTRQAPGATPYTGTWCDRCYRIAGVMHYVWFLVIGMVLGGIVYAALRLFH